MTKLQQELQRLQKLTNEFHKNVSQIADKYKTARSGYINRIGIELKKFRVERRMKQRELASQIGINSAFLSFIENGDSCASTSNNVIEKVFKWAEKNL
jgi:DNA-binding XRE family transcriptional regulator